ncbi:MAG: PIG-L family deacetylase [Clostridiales bacterium]|nr:PIG-L family deacetylase [Clostridiales bacterium]
MTKKLKVLMIGAHMDDNDFRGGGTALRYIKDGHSVRFLSVCNGSGGHHELSAPEVAAIRRKEADAVADLTGIEYDVWDIEDCEIIANLENRKRMVRYIRQYKPDIIFTHRTNDYHADHRNTALLVQDASYLLIVPNFCPDVAALIHTPVIMHFYDRFKNPVFNPDVIIPIDDVIDEKYEMINCHVSQVYEWLPFTNGVLDQVPTDPEERLDWLRKPLVPRDGTQLTEADLNRFIASNNSEYREATPVIKYRDKIIERYGDLAKDILFAEAFEVSEYGNPLNKENEKMLFPF